MIVLAKHDKVSAKQLTEQIDKKKRQLSNNFRLSGKKLQFQAKLS